MFKGLRGGPPQASVTAATSWRRDLSEVGEKRTPATTSPLRKPLNRFEFGKGNVTKSRRRRQMGPCAHTYPDA